MPHDKYPLRGKVSSHGEEGVLQILPKPFPKTQVKDTVRDGQSCTLPHGAGCEPAGRHGATATAAAGPSAVLPSGPARAPVKGPPKLKLVLERAASGSVATPPSSECSEQSPRRGDSPSADALQVWESGKGTWQTQKISPDGFAIPQDRVLVPKSRMGSPAHAQGKSPRKNESPSKEKLRVRKERSIDSVSEPERGHRKISYSEGKGTLKHAGASPPYLYVEEEAWRTAAERLSEYEQSHEGNGQQESLGHPLGPAPGNDSSQPSCYPYDHSSGSIVPPDTRLDNHHLAGEPGDGSHAAYIPPHHHQPAVGSVDGAYPAYPLAQDPQNVHEGGRL